MATKTTITDEMVERYWRAAREPVSQSIGPKEHAKQLLEAALNPAPEPEIVVTDDQRNAGMVAYWRGYGNPKYLTFSNDHWNGMVAAYRAMRNLEPEPLSPFLGGPTPHRRKDDPR